MVIGSGNCSRKRISVSLLKIYILAINFWIIVVEAARRKFLGKMKYYDERGGFSVFLELYFGRLFSILYCIFAALYLSSRFRLSILLFFLLFFFLLLLFSSSLSIIYLSRATTSSSTHLSVNSISQKLI